LRVQKKQKTATSKDTNGGRRGKNVGKRSSARKKKKSQEVFEKRVGGKRFVGTTATFAGGFWKGLGGLSDNVG